MSSALMTEASTPKSDGSHASRDSAGRVSWASWASWYVYDVWSPHTSSVTLPFLVTMSRLSVCGTANAGDVATPSVPVTIQVIVRAGASMSHTQWPVTPPG